MKMMDLLFEFSIDLFSSKGLYIDPTAITTSIVSASGIIIALGAASGALMSTATMVGATAGAFFSKIMRKVYNTFCVVENEGKEVEEDVIIKK